MGVYMGTRDYRNHRSVPSQGVSVISPKLHEVPTDRSSFCCSKTYKPYCIPPSSIMSREFHKMPALPDTINDPKVQELMSHYFATSNHDSDHEGFADMFTADGEYSMNDCKAKGRQGSTIPTLLPIGSESCTIPITILLPQIPRHLHAFWQPNVPYISFQQSSSELIGTNSY